MVLMMALDRVVMTLVIINGQLLMSMPWMAKPSEPRPMSRKVVMAMPSVLRVRIV